MAARVTQSAIEVVTLNDAQVRVTQSIIELAVVLGISCDNPPAGRVGAAYSHTFPAASGDPPFTFAITAGFLPPGLSLNASSGVVSGVPNLGGDYTFTITVTDSFGQQASVTCSIVVVAIGSSQGGATGGPCYSACGCPPALPWRVKWSRLGAPAAPSEHARHVLVKGSIASPAAGVITEICAFQVANKYRFRPESLLLNYSGAGWTPGDGSITFAVTVNQPAGAVTAANFTPYKDFGKVLVPIGSPVTGPYPIYPGELSDLYGRDVIRVTVLTTVAIPAGLPNVFTAAIGGRTWPELIKGA